MTDRRHVVVLDWDGTLVENRWPHRDGDWMPGAIDAVLKLARAGFHLVVFSARLSPLDPITWKERPPARVKMELDYIRDKLDSAGLTFVDIWTKPGKPGGAVYVDDRAERYHGKTHSWRTLADKIILRFDGVEPEFPHNGGNNDQPVHRGR